MFENYVGISHHLNPYSYFSFGFRAFLRARSISKSDRIRETAKKTRVARQLSLVPHPLYKLALNSALRAPLFVFCYQKFDIRLLPYSIKR